MPVGDCERAFAGAAAADGVRLGRARVAWLNQRGHLGLPPEAQSAREVLHGITSFRALSLRLYPPEVPLGYDRNEYHTLCGEWAPRSDRYRRSKPARGFGPAGRQRQRAYHDALRDLATPAMGRPPVVRVPVLDGDGAAAYLRVRDDLRRQLGC